MVRALGFFLLLVLTGCASYTQAPPDTGVTLPPSNEFTAEGKIGVRSQEVNETARFIWIQQGPDYEIELLDPFGRRVMNLMGETGQVVLRSKSNPKPQIATTPEELMQKLLGWQIPVAPARFWLQGHPASGVKFNQLEKNRFEQLGWTVDILDLQQLDSSGSVPRKVRLTHTDLQLTLIISKWTFTN